jgi:hypothetical protein
LRTFLTEPIYISGKNYLRTLSGFTAHFAHPDVLF